MKKKILHFNYKLLKESKISTLCLSKSVWWGPKAHLCPDFGKCGAHTPAAPFSYASVIKIVPVLL